jgi:hypothetical protein
VCVDNVESGCDDVLLIAPNFSVCRLLDLIRLTCFSPDYKRVLYVWSVKPPVDSYKPIHFMRCHFCDKNALKKGHTDDDPTDEVTNVWCCVMEPDPSNHGQLNVKPLSSVAFLQVLYSNYYCD